MAQRSDRPTPSKHRRRPPQDSRPKFDRWLEERSSLHDPVVLNFHEEPVPGVGTVDVLARIITVDRYFIAVEFNSLVSEVNGGTWWIDKANIKAATCV